MPCRLRRAAAVTERPGSRMGLARTCERGDERGVNRELRALPKGQALGHDFDAPVVCDGHVDVHVGDSDVASDTRTGFAANPRNGALKWPCARGKHAAGSARGTVVPESVEPATTTAREGGEWQGQAPQEQNAELRIRNGLGLVRGRDGDGSGRVWPSLRQQQRMGRKGEVRKMRHDASRMRARRTIRQLGAAIPAGHHLARKRSRAPAARLRRQAGKVTYRRSFGAGSFNQLPPRWERAWASSPSTMPGCRSRSVGRVSAQEAQCAAGRIVGQQRPQKNLI